MHFGFYAPNFGAFGDARALADLAREAEDAGWDGVAIAAALGLELEPDVCTRTLAPGVAHS